MYLENIHSPREVKQLKVEQLNELASEIREALLTKLSKHGGHVASNLGMVETTIALHYVFESPNDKMVYDVSHQTYVHKMLTGRNMAFLDASQYNSVSGFSNPEESEHDLFCMGHTSTSISLACGLAKMRDLKKEHSNIIAIIGDGSLSGGEAYEGLNNAAEANTNMIIIVNDNEMSIAENYGGLYRNLAQLRESNGTCENNFFKTLGLQYHYVSDGHNIESLIETFDQVKDAKHPVVVHIHTTKGKGFVAAEQDKETWHFNGPFDLQNQTNDAKKVETYESVISNIVKETLHQNANAVAITSGTPGIFGFDKQTKQSLKEQFVDVGIAEEHAIAYASAIAQEKGTPIYAVYSTFLQRTYDQISHDLCLNNNPAVVLVYAASVYGMNDKTHLGIYDIGMLSNIPNLVYLAPSSKEEMEAMLHYATTQKEHPVFIRVPSVALRETGQKDTFEYANLNTYKVEKQGKDVAIITFGNFYEMAKDIVDTLEEEHDINATFINATYLSGLDKKLLSELLATHNQVITIEDGILDGGLGERIASFYGPSTMKVHNFAIAKGFPDRYDVASLLKENGITKENIIQTIVTK